MPTGLYTHKLDIHSDDTIKFPFWIQCLEFEPIPLGIEFPLRWGHKKLL